MADDYFGVRSKTFSNGDTYTGTWSPAGLPDGEGKYTRKDGSIYDGTWKDGMRHGIGKYTWASGATYAGEWREGHLQGVGTWELLDACGMGAGGTAGVARSRFRYQGGWHQDLKHGLGRQVFANGDVYEGIWKCGLPDGPGRLVYADGNEYDGEWRAGRMHGHGTFVWATGERYDGQWKDGRMDGVGLFTSTDGSTHEGRWRRGRKHGPGLHRPAAGSYTLAGTGTDALAGGPASPRGGGPTAAGAAGGGGAWGMVASFGRRLSGAGGSPGASAQHASGDGQGAGLGSPSASMTAGGLGAGGASGPSGSAGGARHRGLSASAPIPFPTPPPSAPASPRGRPPPLRVPPNGSLDGPLPSDAPAPDSPVVHWQHQPGTPGTPGLLGRTASVDSPSPFSGGSSPLPASASTPAAPSFYPAIHTGALDIALVVPAPEPSAGLRAGPGQGPGAGGAPVLPSPSHRQGVPASASFAAASNSAGGIGSGPGGGGSPGGGGGGASGSGRAVVLLRVYDRGRPVRETALDAEAVEGVMPRGLGPGLGGAGGRAATRDGLFRRLRGGAMAAVGGGSRQRLGDTVTRAHHAYSLLVALQLGVRYSVGRISHEPLPRTASPDEYALKITQEFPRQGSEMTPVHPVEDFTWTDYAPSTFRRLRESAGLDASSYMLSLCSDHALRHLASPGKSGSFFFLSQDERFFVKTMARCELEVLLAMLPAYHRHVEDHPHTLLSRFFGLHAVTTPSGRKFRFVVMSNIFRTPLPLPVHLKFDLKGSTLGRTAGRPLARDPAVVYKDLDLDLGIRLEEGWRERLLFQLRADCALLAGVGVMDYSLLVGVHLRGPGAAAGGGGGGGQQQQGAPGVEAVGAGAAGAGDGGRGGAAAPSTSVHGSGTEELARMEERLPRLRLGEAAARDLLEVGRMRLQAASAFNRDGSAAAGAEGGLESAGTAPAEGGASAHGPTPGGAAPGDAAPSPEPLSANDELALRLGQSRVALGLGMAATAVHKDGTEEAAVLWFAIIDILQPYNATKRIEHGLKSMLHGAHSISVTHPLTYANRFQTFLQGVFVE
ncbi:hypothetical protein HYH03_012678 [Edaphochlamys debaryana]|uniref:1-phosphatidylinositol-4-phosphate 5-kinase n=1 Tax=Edaphochlamys debaryana TaxID=47281 RepID=A0A835Y0E2_9CHLO|nr:hypothetical protein HYH03_012678 [Edaphochlamys debaryana]|eukprot:KAG2488884.1 hypothetical protein HYH03_012678 [Edaphochlamys debaryana]